MTQLGLFDYPDAAGHKGGGASTEAATKITTSGLKHSLEIAVMSLFHSGRNWTPDEAAAELGHHPADIRPRFSELTIERRDKHGNPIRQAFLRKTPQRRLSARGNSQHVYERICVTAI